MAKSGKVEKFSEAGRRKLNEWLAGCEAVKEGAFDIFFIETPHELITVRPANADEVMSSIKKAFNAH